MPPANVYLSTKKAGKNDPKTEEIKADNAARQEWNQTADIVLLTGICEAKVLEVMQEETQEKISQSVQVICWLSRLFRAIEDKTRGFLQRADPPAGDAAEAHIGH